MMDSVEAQTAIPALLPKIAKTTRSRRIEKRLPGRPKSYTPTIGKAICDRLIAGDSLKTISKKIKRSTSCIMEWLITIPEFEGMYAHARLAQADTFADQIIGIADRAKLSAESINKARLQVDARKWVASKLKPQKYGERVEQHLSGSLSLAALLEGARSPQLTHKLSTGESNEPDNAGRLIEHQPE